MDTIGSLIDELTIVNLRIWAAEDLKRKVGATDQELAVATKLTNSANSFRNDLIQAIDERINDIAAGKKQKLYKRGDSKMYGK